MIQIVVKTPNEAVVLENEALITTGTNDLDLSNNVDHEFSSVTRSADLSVDLKAEEDPARAGNPLKLTLTVANLGVSSALGVGTTVLLPAGSSFISANGTDWVCNFAVGTITCTLDQIDVGQEEQVTIIIFAPKTGMNFVTHASVSSSSGDPVTENNSIDLTTSLKYMQFIPVLSIAP